MNASKWAIQANEPAPLNQPAPVDEPAPVGQPAPVDQLAPLATPPILARQAHAANRPEMDPELSDTSQSNPSVPGATQRLGYETGNVPTTAERDDNPTEPVHDASSSPSPDMERSRQGRPGSPTEIGRLIDAFELLQPGNAIPAPSQDLNTTMDDVESSQQGTSDLSPPTPSDESSLWPRPLHVRKSSKQQDHPMAAEASQPIASFVKSQKNPEQEAKIGFEAEEMAKKEQKKPSSMSPGHVSPEATEQSSPGPEFNMNAYAAFVKEVDRRDEASRLSSIGKQAVEKPPRRPTTWAEIEKIDQAIPVPTHEEVIQFIKEKAPEQVEELFRSMLEQGVQKLVEQTMSAPSWDESCKRHPDLRDAMRNAEKMVADAKNNAAIQSQKINEARARVRGVETQFRVRQDYAATEKDYLAALAAEKMVWLAVKEADRDLKSAQKHMKSAQLAMVKQIKADERLVDQDRIDRVRDYMMSQRLGEALQKRLEAGDPSFCSEPGRLILRPDIFESAPSSALAAMKTIAQEYEKSKSYDQWSGLSEASPIGIPLIKNVRRVKISNLPAEYDAIEVQSLVWGGSLERLDHVQGESSAVVMFMDTLGCAKYIAAAAGGVELPKQNGKKAIVEVSKHEDPHPEYLRGLRQDNPRFSRVLRMRLYDFDWTIPSLVRVASRGGKKVVHIRERDVSDDERSVKRGSANSTVREIEFQFATIYEAVRFKYNARQDLEIDEHKEIRIWSGEDPCAVAAGVHEGV